jgi:hypothetical protein
MTAMHQIEQRLQQRFPEWFHGPRRHLARPLLRVGRWSRLDQVQKPSCATTAARGFGFVAAALEFLGGRYQLDPARWRGSRPPGGC